MKKDAHVTHPLENYAGTYLEPAYGEIVIERSGDDLHMTFPKKKNQTGPPLLTIPSMRFFWLPVGI